MTIGHKSKLKEYLTQFYEDERMAILTSKFEKKMIQQIIKEYKLHTKFQRELSRQYTQQMH